MSDKQVIDIDHDWYLPKGFIEQVENDPQLAYADTDSVSKDSVIIVDNNNITIEDFYNLSDGKIEKLKNNKYIKHLSKQYKSPSLNKKGDLENNKIINVVKHKVKKRMFKITLGDTSVCITEDHSLIVFRGSKICEIKPRDIQKNDKLFKIQRGTKM